VSAAGEGAALAVTTPARRTRRPGVLVLLGLAVAVQLVVLYSPDGGGPPPFAQADKVVHLLVFLVPAALAVVAGFRRRVVVAVFAAQAVLSEGVQAVLLPHRSGDVLDAVADLTGVALGVLVGSLVLRALASRAAARSPS
jgi:VanZ family protein